MDAITYCNHKVYVITSLKRSWLIFDAVLVWIILIEMQQAHSPFYEIQFVILTSVELFFLKFFNKVYKYSWQLDQIAAVTNLLVPGSPRFIF